MYCEKHPNVKLKPLFSSFYCGVCDQDSTKGCSGEDKVESPSLTHHIPFKVLKNPNPSQTKTTINMPLKFKDNRIVDDADITEIYLEKVSRYNGKCEESQPVEIDWLKVSSLLDDFINGGFSA